MPNYDPNSDDYHYPPRHQPDPMREASAPDLRSDERKEIDAGWAEARRLRAELAHAKAELRDWQDSSEAYRHDAERAEARVVELEALCTAQHGAVTRAEKAEARVAELAEANDHLHNLCAEKHGRAERAEAERDVLREVYFLGRVVSHEEGMRMIQEPEPNDGVIVREDGSVATPAHAD